MSSGILKSRYVSRVHKSKTLANYIFALGELVLYEINVFNFNRRDRKLFFFR